MDLLLFAIALLGVPVCLVLLLVFAIRRRSLKPVLIGLFTCVVCFVASMMMPTHPRQDEATMDRAMPSSVSEESETEARTEEATEPETEAPTEIETEPPTEPPTDEPTEPETEAATEENTEAPTEPPTEPEAEAQPEPEPETEREIIVYLPENGEKYHYEDCWTLKGHGRPVTLEEAKRLGYEPCGVCHPPIE